MAARMIAERLVSQLGWDVEIFTTRAKDIVTWDNEYPDGDETLNGVLVHRFEVTSGRPPHFFSFSERLLSAPDAATMSEGVAFVETQGPGAPALVEALRDCDRDLIAFYPYLYTPTVDGVEAVADRAVMHPAAHDEPALHLPVFRRTMTQVQGFAFHTRGERDLVQRLFPVADLPQAVIGLGFDEPDETVGSGRPPGELLGIGDRPYVLCLGPRGRSKGHDRSGGVLRRLQGEEPGASDAHARGTCDGSAAPVA